VIDGVKALLAGAHAVQIVSAVLQQGPQHFRAMEQGLRYWMSHHRHESIDDFRGQSNLKRCSDPAHFERASYLRVLQAWSG
jgi:dihydroorotate dehydrogenase (fumarate)